MLNEGQWLDEGLTSPTSLSNWQPDGCMLANYGPKQFSSCLSGRTLIFTGDSIVRRIFLQALNVLDPGYDTTKLDGMGEKHRDHSIVAGGIELQYIFDPYLNSSRTIDILERRDKTQKNKDGSKPALFVLGSGLWELRRLEGDKVTKVYIEAIERIISATSATSTKNKNRPQIADEIILIPVEHTVHSKLDSDRVKTMRNEGISKLNAELRKRIPPYQSSTISDLSVLYALNKLIDTPLAVHHTEDGLHYDKAVVGTQLNLILNLRCNDVMPKKFPFDKTCCMQYPAPNWVQIIIILFALIWAPLGTHYYTSSES